MDEPTIDVMIPCYNEVESIDRALKSVEDQSRSPRRVLVAEGGSTDGTRKRLEAWTSRLPLVVLDNPRRRQAPGLNQCIERSDATYLARLDAHSYWNITYLSVLLEVLESRPSLGAAGGRVEVDPDVSGFQRDVWVAMTHKLGTGGPPYRRSEEPGRVETVQSPVYRREALEEVGGFREDLPWAEDDELHSRLRGRDWKLWLEPGARIFYVPRSGPIRFFSQFHNYGVGRGSLGAQGIFPTKRHQQIDHALMVWTLGLCWNPVGWALACFYGMLPVVLTLQSLLEGTPRPRLLYLFPLMHAAYWLGWIKGRFGGR